MASIQKRGKKYRAIVRRHNFNSSATFEKRSEAILWARKIEKELADLGWGDRYTPKEPFSCVIEKYLREVTPQKRGAKKEALRLKKLLEMPLAQVPLSNLTDDHFRAWRDARLKCVSADSVLREWATLNNMLNYAVHEWKLLIVNPLKFVRKPKKPRPRQRRLMPYEIERLLNVAGYRKDSAPSTSAERVGAAILFAIETGMRAGEIVNLTWENVNLSLRIAHIPKTKNGYPRDIPLSLKAVKIIEQLSRVKRGERIFRLSSGNLDQIFRGLRDKAEIEDLHFHDTRREALTRMAKKVDVMTLAKISGHRDLSILQNTYYAPDMAELSNQRILNHTKQKQIAYLIPLFSIY
ncbi:site-specific integrase [Pasteurellaceae bacterium TAE3-ERU1]|nr:site-specific integrase [Pasteurellaceae bacterium TAE3-ERU1]